MAREIPDYSIIKIKLGSDDDEGRVRAIREARPDAKLRVDANAGWTVDHAIHHLRWLEKYDLELIEHRTLDGRSQRGRTDRLLNDEQDRLESRKQPFVDRRLASAAIRSASVAHS